MFILSFFYLYISKKRCNFALVIELERHIEILLLSNDCVIVPDLGGFMTHHVDAKYDEGDGLFLPPRRTLGFNPQLSINDSLMALSYMEAYDISYPEAQRRIEDEVNELKQHIENDGSYELNDIGTLSFNDDGNYVFTPCEAGLLTPSLYGLGSFEMKKLDAAETTTQPESIEKNQEKVTASVIPMATTTEYAPMDSGEEDEDDDVIKIKFTWIRNTIAVAAVLLAIFILALPTGKTEMMTRTISNLNNTILFGMMSKDTNTSTIEIRKQEFEHKLNKVDTIIKKETIAPQQPQVKVDSVKQGYCIVLASHVSQQNAKIFIEQLQKRGYDQAEVYMHNNVRRVIYGHFKTQDDAYNALKDIHQHKDLSEAWVYKFI